LVETLFYKYTELINFFLFLLVLLWNFLCVPNSHSAHAEKKKAIEFENFINFSKVIVLILSSYYLIMYV